MQFKEDSCYAFKEAGDRIVALVFRECFKVVVYEGGKLLYTSKEKCGGPASFVVENSKVYFANEVFKEDETPENHLFELNLQTFEEKLLMPHVCAFSGTPGELNFVGISRSGLVQTMGGEFCLNSVFEKIQGCSWNSILSLERFAVISGWSGSNILDGEILRKELNYFLLIDLINLTVVNRKQPLSVEWGGESNSVVSCSSEARLRHFHAML